VVTRIVLRTPIGRRLLFGRSEVNERTGLASSGEFTYHPPPAARALSKRVLAWPLINGDWLPADCGSRVNHELTRVPVPFFHATDYETFTMSTDAPIRSTAIRSSTEPAAAIERSAPARSMPAHSMPTILSPTWRWPALVGCQAAALLLTVSFVWSPMRAGWDALDASIFRLLNGSLAMGHTWQQFWAYANWRPLDVLPAVLLMLVFIVSIRRDERSRQLALWTYLLLVGLCLIVVKPIAIFVVHDMLGYFRPSPTLTLDAPLRLSVLVPSIAAKDASPYCFPSDHAFVLMTVMSLFWFFGRRSAAIAATIITIVFTLPRMVSGAHWATDTLVGGAVMTLVAVGWLFATPLHYHVARLCYPIVRRLNRVLPPWHGAGR
jgi:membrane-associated phospholipid phosphatase